MKIKIFITTIHNNNNTDWFNAIKEKYIYIYMKFGFNQIWC